MKELNLTHYARIGKAPLLRCVGLQKNYKEKIETSDPVIDEVESGCFECPNYNNKRFSDLYEDNQKEVALQPCKECESAVYHTISRYVNEKNKYGYTSCDPNKSIDYNRRLGKFSIKILVLLHFLDPDTSGVVRNISYSKIAKKLNCDYRTVKNNIDLLSDYEYISVYPGFRSGRHNIVLNEYRKYHLEAKDGGRGYFVISKNILNDILDIKDVTLLRITMRTLSDADVKSKISKDIVLNKTFSDIRRYLPNYCKPNVIIKALNKSNLLKTTKYDVEEDELSIHIPLQYNSRYQHYKLEIEHQERLQKYIESINNTFDEFNELKSIDEKAIMEKKITAFGIYNAYEKYKPYIINTSDYKDLSQISVRYGFECVKDTLVIVYNQNVSANITVENLPGLVRTIIKDNLFLSAA